MSQPQTTSILNPVNSFPNTMSGSNLSSEQTMASYTGANNTGTTNISPVDMQHNAVYNTTSK